MDLSSVFVNAEFLSMYQSHRVRAMIQVISRSDSGTVIGESTDNQHLTVIGIDPDHQLTKFVEVVGIAVTNYSIHAETWTNFGDKFDMSRYNNICQLANGKFKHLFI